MYISAPGKGKQRSQSIDGFPISNEPWSKINRYVGPRYLPNTKGDDAGVEWWPTIGQPTPPRPRKQEWGRGLICKGIGGFTRRDTSGHLSVGRKPGGQEHTFAGEEIREWRRTRGPAGLLSTFRDDLLCYLPSLAIGSREPVSGASELSILFWLFSWQSWSSSWWWCRWWGGTPWPAWLRLSGSTRLIVM